MSPTLTSEITKVSQRYRLALKARDARVLSDLAREYQNVHRVAAREWRAMSRQILRAQRAGEPITPGWLYRQGRLASLIEQVDTQLAIFTNGAGKNLRGEQNGATADAASYAHKATEAAMVTGNGSLAGYWTRVTPRTVETVLANTAPGGPVDNLFKQINTMGADEARSTIVNGVTQGYHPRKIAQELRQTLDVSLTRAQTIARTEVMRSQREVIQQSYAENSDVVNGYIWSSAQDDNTCEDCWALDGEIFDTDTEPEAHINCRCTLEPDVTSLADLGAGAEGEPSLPDGLDPEGIAPELYRAGANIDEADGTVTVFHWTSPESRDAIERSGRLIPGPVESSFNKVWFTTDRTNPVYGHVRDIGGESVPMRFQIPISELDLDRVINEGAMMSMRARASLDVSQYLTSGPAQFARLSEQQQLGILGPAKYRAWKSGAVELRDFIGHRESQVWGKSTYARSLKEILGLRKAKTFYRAPGSL